MRKRVRLVVRALTAALVVAISACTPGIGNDGPLLAGAPNDGQPTGWTCGPGNPDNARVVADMVVLKNKGDVDVVVSDVSLVDSRQLKLAGAEMSLAEEGAGPLPIGGSYENGTGDSDFGDAVGMTIDAGSSGMLVVGVDALGNKNALKQIRVDYSTSDGEEYYVLTNNAFMVRENCTGVEHRWPDGYGYEE